LIYLAEECRCWLDWCWAVRDERDDYQKGNGAYGDIDHKDVAPAHCCQDAAEQWAKDTCKAEASAEASCGDSEFS